MRASRNSSALDCYFSAGRGIYHSGREPMTSWIPVVSAPAGRSFFFHQKSSIQHERGSGVWPPPISKENLLIINSIHSIIAVVAFDHFPLTAVKYLKYSKSTA